MSDWGDVMLVVLGVAVGVTVASALLVGKIADAVRFNPEEQPCRPRHPSERPDVVPAGVSPGLKPLRPVADVPGYRSRRTHPGLQGGVEQLFTPKTLLIVTAVVLLAPSVGPWVTGHLSALF